MPINVIACLCLVALMFTLVPSLGWLAGFIEILAASTIVWIYLIEPLLK